MARLCWDGGEAVMEPLGGMVAPLRLRLEDGRWVEPLAIAPWAGEALPGAPGILRGLRGDFPCVPFGGGDPGPLAAPWAGVPFAAEGPPHGFAANSDWQVGAADGMLAGRIDYPNESPIAELSQELRPAGPGRVEMLLRVVARRAARLPLALHPIFRLSAEPGGTRVDLGVHGAVRVHPTLAGEDPCPLLPDGVAESLAQLPARDGKARDYSRLPLAEGIESRLLVTGSGGRVRLLHGPEGWAATLEWEAAVLPSVMLWVSNRGRQGAPWSGRHLALGVEPCAAAFDLGVAASAGPNPLAAEGVATALALAPGQPLVIRHAISVAGLDG